MNFKKSSIYVALGVSLTMTACTVTDLQPQTALSETTAFQTPERIALAVAGVYDGGQSGFYAGGAVRGYNFGAAHLEQGDARGEDMALAATFYGITYQSTYDANQPNNVYYWQNAYAMINRANVVIAGLATAQPSASLTQAQIDAYVAECRYLRAMAHHYLLVNFSRPFGDNPTAAAGGVPYRTTPVTGGASVNEAIQQGRNTVAECYDRIIEDLNYAEEKLPDTRAGNLKITRVTKGAAIALKTRVRLHQNNWAEVIREANKLVPTAAPFTSPIGAYALTGSPLGAFGSANKSNSESIFSMENNDVDNAGVNGAPAAMYTASSLGGRGIILISPILWNQPFFPAGDLRKATGTAVAADPASSSGKGGYFTRKYPDATTRTENAPIIRYAEVLLNLAEALSRSGSAVDTRAVALLSAVRNRSVTTAANQYTAASFASGNELTRAIINERRPEFLAEGLRWLDIHRLSTDATFRQAAGIPAKAAISITNFAPLYTNTATTTFPTEPAIPYSDYRFLWPIPLEEINNNPVLATQQNPGY
ncbi:RagB/SusD family nutrient uptake outer membrane protein [Spirosoma sp. KUDC1026]|uniref:RagB/SusD family nutrient uptake outer membrane protein n=1 Tax=Spirosoma sp. KUDC1026 TaxID=2745947 RepID=UPI00159BE34A|nr:RagB/SusD family nutrient uptake outer membrane protein [Spirosoma sp. KUDC1026]QKZ15258.1 RagB/SusD family nutrient uptake outer membrane protein [Spirosoma sp. KUDC1026]